MAKLLCFLGLHDWEITQWISFRDKRGKQLHDKGFDRTCLKCDKRQTLARPKEYHPCKYVWVDLNPKPKEE